MLLPFFRCSLFESSFPIIGVRMLLLVTTTGLTSRFFSFPVGCLWWLRHLFLMNLLDRTPLSGLWSHHVVRLCRRNRLAWLLILQSLVYKKLIFLLRALYQLWACEAFQILANDYWMFMVVCDWVEVHAWQIVLLTDLCQDVIVSCKRFSRVLFIYFDFLVLALVKYIAFMLSISQWTRAFRVIVFICRWSHGVARL